MADSSKQEEFYSKLKVQLEESTTWPSVYLYKFIIPSSNEKVAQIEEIFDGMEAKIYTKDSSKGKYTSVSVEVELASPDEVIAKYKEVGEQVEDIISL